MFAISRRYLARGLRRERREGAGGVRALSCLRSLSFFVLGGVRWSAFALSVRARTLAAVSLVVSCCLTQLYISCTYEHENLPDLSARLLWSAHNPHRWPRVTAANVLAWNVLRLHTDERASRASCSEDCQFRSSKGCLKKSFRTARKACSLRRTTWRWSSPQILPSRHRHHRQLTPWK